MEEMDLCWLTDINPSVYILSISTSLEANVTPTIEPYFLSLFKAHGFLSSVYVAINIALAVGKPPLAKVLDVFGRAEGIALSGVTYGIGYVLIAFAGSIQMFGVGKIVAALGSQGLQLSQQVVVADTSSLTSRAFIISTISLPWLFTTWIGPPIGNFFLLGGETLYRIAYLIFAVLVPLSALYLSFRLFWEWNRVARFLRSLQEEDDVESDEESVEKLAGIPTHLGDAFGAEGGLRVALKNVWRELDGFGMLLLTLGCSFILFPLSVGAEWKKGWGDYRLYLFLFFGFLTLALFARVEQRSKYPILPPRLAKNTTIVAGCCLGFWHFASQFIYETYFTSFLQVARGHSARDAQYISQTYIFTASVSSVFIGILTKISGRYKIWGLIGVIIHTIGELMMVRFRRLDNPTWELVLSQVVGGIGGGFTTVAGQVGVQSVVGSQDIACATALFLTITQIGGALGSAISGALWTTLLPSRLRVHLPPASQYLIPDIVSSLSVALSFPPEDPIRVGINEAYTDVQRVLNGVAILALIGAFIGILGMRNVDLNARDEVHEYVRVPDIEVEEDEAVEDEEHII
ncbi:MFS general substrate transporter [Atractiella rhizophila]|nr:MFS general substrate transporter [Atractiella rhizophila]